MIEAPVEPAGDRRRGEQAGQNVGKSERDVSIVWGRSERPPAIT